jgi:hypothetical protein
MFHTLARKRATESGGGLFSSLQSGIGGKSTAFDAGLSKARESTTRPSISKLLMEYRYDDAFAEASRISNSPEMAAELHREIAEHRTVNMSKFITEGGGPTSINTSVPPGDKNPAIMGGGDNSAPMSIRSGSVQTALDGNSRWKHRTGIWNSGTA